MARPRIVAFYSPQGGVGTTQYTASTCIRGQEHGLDVVGATLGRNHDLRPQLEHAGVRWQDGLESLPETCDLLVLDINSGSGLLDVVKPDLWIVPMRRNVNLDHVMSLRPSLEGAVWWLPTHGYAPRLLPAEARGTVTLARPIPDSDAMVQSFDAMRSVWSSHPKSSAAAAVEPLVADMLAHVGLAGACGDLRRLSYRGKPKHAWETDHGYSAREEAARPGLAAYFESIRRQRAN